MKAAKSLVFVSLLVIAATLLGACAAPAPQVSRRSFPDRCRFREGEQVEVVKTVEVEKIKEVISTVQV